MSDGKVKAVLQFGGKSADLDAAEAAEKRPARVPLSLGSIAGGALLARAEAALRALQGDVLWHHREYGLRAVPIKARLTLVVNFEQDKEFHNTFIVSGTVSAKRPEPPALTTAAHLDPAAAGEPMTVRAPEEEAPGDDQGELLGPDLVDKATGEVVARGKG